MSIFTLTLLFLLILMLLWAVWFILSLIHYIRSGQYEIDQRLREVCKRTPDQRAPLPCASPATPGRS